ncbi:MAG: hypothetical protein HY231_20640 [Acidobacteria bacterium]|nr:hypothetical protein [Acidobacteriota bacterium]
MRIRTSDTNEISEICREEFEAANRRIGERLKQFEQRPASSTDEKLEGVRRFYEDLADKNWTKADEEVLKGLEGMSESDIKAKMREGFRKAQLYPVPNFAYIINALKSDARLEVAHSQANTEAVSAAERERLANVLQRELTEAARDIAASLRLSETNMEIIREQLEITQGNIIGRLTPLA